MGTLLRDAPHGGDVVVNKKLDRSMKTTERKILEILVVLRGVDLNQEDVDLLLRRLDELQAAIQELRAAVVSGPGA